MKFNRTEQAARVERTSKWDLIAAIADDAEDNGLAITGAGSQVAAKEALDAAGSEYTARTIKELCLVAKFDHESTSEQRQLWRTYGWTIARLFALHGASQESAADYLSAQHRSRRDVYSHLSSLVDPDQPAAATATVDDGWRHWLNQMNRLLIDGAKLAERTDEEVSEPSAYTALARLVYDRITERKLAAEIRDFLESAEAEV